MSVRRACASELAMALTLPRWIVVAALGCLAVWGTVLRPKATSTAPRAPISGSARVAGADAEVGAAMIQASDRLRLLQIRDSVLRQSAPRGDSALIVMIGASFGA